MDRSFLRSTPFIVALPVALLAAGAYFIFAPTPPARVLLTPGVGAANPAPENVWQEWRTPEFYEMRAALDRSNPVEVVHEVFRGFRDAAYPQVLAYSSKRLQERNTPESLRQRLAFAPGFTGWTEILVDKVDTRDSRVIVDGRSVGVDDTHFYRAMLAPEDDGWAFDYLWVARSEEERDQRWPRRAEPQTTEPMVTPRHPAPPPAPERSAAPGS